MKNNSRLGLWVIIPGWILAFAARMAQICVGTDMTSGFLKYDNGFFMNACFWGAVILTLAGAAAAAFFDRRNGSAYYQTPDCSSPLWELSTRATARRLSRRAATFRLLRS